MTEISGSAQTLDASTAPTGQRYLLVVPLQGRYTVHGADRQLALNASQCCLLGHGIGQKLVFDEDFRQVHVRFDAAELLRNGAAWRASALSVIESDAGGGALLKQSILSILEHGTVASMGRKANLALWRALQQLVVAALAPLAADESAQAASETDSLKTQVDQLIEREIANPELSVGFIAKRLGVTPRHLHRLYASEAQTLSRTILGTRLDHCLRELIAPQRSAQTINDVALSWGFNDQAHFSRQFRQRFGVTAREARLRGQQAARGGEAPSASDGAEAHAKD